VVFKAPTDATNEMLTAIRPHAAALYANGTRYRKTGVVFFGLLKADAPLQTDLFSGAAGAPPPGKSALYGVIDAINAKYGRGTLFSAAEGVGRRPWAMKRELLSPRPTTRWNELLVAGRNDRRIDRTSSSPAASGDD
jgi:DNA polymerase V